MQTNLLLKAICYIIPLAAAIEQDCDMNSLCSIFSENEILLFTLELHCLNSLLMWLHFQFFLWIYPYQRYRLNTYWLVMLFLALRISVYYSRRNLNGHPSNIRKIIFAFCQSCFIFSTQTFSCQLASVCSPWHFLCRIDWGIKSRFCMKYMQNELFTKALCNLNSYQIATLNCTPLTLRLSNHSVSIDYDI